VILLSDDDGLLDRVDRELEQQLALLSRADVARSALASSVSIKVAGLDEAFEVSNGYAPEHLIVAVRDARAWLPLVQAAGSVFLGDWAPRRLATTAAAPTTCCPPAARRAPGAA